MARRHAALLVALLFVAAPAGATSPPSDPQGLLSFARALLAAGESFRAATEYLRFLHHFGDLPEAEAALRGLGEAYAQAGRWDEAAAAFRRLPPDPEAGRLLGAALYQGRRYEEAARVLLGTGGRSPDPTLGTLALLRAGRTDTPAPARPELGEQYRTLPRKSPPLAGTLAAVVPGAGHLYAERPRDAAVSFVLNAAFLWGTVEAVRREEWALAGVLGLFELGWYSGNLVSAMNAAHKWNQREQERFFRPREEGALPRWGLVVAPGLVGGAVAWSW